MAIFNCYVSSPEGKSWISGENDSHRQCIVYNLVVKLGVQVDGMTTLHDDHISVEYFKKNSGYYLEVQFQV